jgi:hypothetical protein
MVKALCAGGAAAFGLFSSAAERYPIGLGIGGIRLEGRDTAWVNRCRKSQDSSAITKRLLPPRHDAGVWPAPGRIVLCSTVKFPSPGAIAPGVHACIGWMTHMKFLSYAYRFASNFLFLALVYYSLNFLDKYSQRAVVAIMVLIYSGMRAASALRSFYFFQRIERLEVEARRLSVAAGEGHSANSQRKLIVNEVSGLRHAGEMKSYIDLLFLAFVVLLCVSKLVTE